MPGENPLMKSCETCKHREVCCFAQALKNEMAAKAKHEESLGLAFRALGKDCSWFVKG